LIKPEGLLLSVARPTFLQVNQAEDFEELMYVY
jgi:hypothetical protein